jgi:hypothetical protein
MRLPALLIAAVSVALTALAQDSNVIAPPDVFQVRYASNLNVGDSYVNITNSGSTEVPDPAASNICVNVYTFDASEEMVSCCACLVTPNALVSLSVQGDLISNTLSPSTPSSVVIKLLATIPGMGGTPATCDPAATAVSGAQGMRAWGTTLHALPTTPRTYGVTEGAFLAGGLSAGEVVHLISFCGFIESNGSGFGICKSCRAGGLGGARQ